MVSVFEFATSPRIVFGAGLVNETVLDVVVRQWQSRCLLLVWGRSGSTRFRDLEQQLQDKGVRVATLSCSREPTIEDIQSGTDLARLTASTAVIAIGGGSVLDSGKAIAALATNPGDVLDYCEVVGKGLQLTERPLRMIAVPTTAGTGSEVTRNAVVTSMQHNIKVSIRSAQMIPDIALIDPELTLSCPPAVTASSGLDALTQCIEPFVSVKANPITDALAAEGIRRAAKSLAKAYAKGDDLEARSDMALASLLGGMSLANAKLGAVHGFAGVLGGLFETAPHGAICAALLPHVFAANAKALSASSDKHHGEFLKRHHQVAAWVTGKEEASIEEGASFLLQLTKELGVPALRTYGMQVEMVDTVVTNSMKSSSMKGNPIMLDEATLSAILMLAI